MFSIIAVKRMNTGDDSDDDFDRKDYKDNRVYNR